eukprot:2520383-Ditylum_brightwellii.AAC.1
MWRVYKEKEGDGMYVVVGDGDNGGDGDDGVDGNSNIDTKNGDSNVANNVGFYIPHLCAFGWGGGEASWSSCW